MKTVTALLACALLFTACDFTTPLVKSPATDIDRALIGLWERAPKGGNTEYLLVLPLGKQEYLVSFPGGKDAMFARACLCSAAGMTLVQLEWIGTAQGKLPEDGRVFQFATCAVSGDKITVRLLNGDIVDRNAASADELAKAVAANKDDPRLFREEMVFSKARQ